MKTLSQLTEQADKLFSEYIRRRTADGNGIVTCVTCGKKDHWKQMHCGHYVSRAKFGTRYLAINANVQCPGCNSKHNEDKHTYMMYMLKNYPVGTLPELTKLSLKFYSGLDRRQELERVIKDLKIKIKRECI